MKKSYRIYNGKGNTSTLDATSIEIEEMWSSLSDETIVNLIVNEMYKLEWRFDYYDFFLAVPGGDSLDENFDEEGFPKNILTFKIVNTAPQGAFI